MNNTINKIPIVDIISTLFDLELIINYALKHAIVHLIVLVILLISRRLHNISSNILLNIWYIIVLYHSLGISGIKDRGLVCTFLTFNLFESK
jgi:hypothetical protein